jgi:hypothetical protein
VLLLGVTDLDVEYDDVVELLLQGLGGLQEQQELLLKHPGGLCL